MPNSRLRDSHELAPSEPTKKSGEKLKGRADDPHLGRYCDQTSKVLESMKAWAVTYEQQMTKLKDVEALNEKLSKFREDLSSKDTQIKELQTCVRQLSASLTTVEGEKVECLQAADKKHAELCSKLERDLKTMRLEKLEQKKGCDIALEKKLQEAAASAETRTQQLKTKYDANITELEKRMSGLQREVGDLKAALKQKEEYSSRLVEQLSECKTRLDDVIRSRRTFADDLGKQEQKHRREMECLGFRTQTVDFYTKGFRRIAQMIDVLASHHCKNLENLKPKVRDDIHHWLCQKDASFEFVPISKTVTSRSLCKAHFQRVASKALCDFVWRRFSADAISPGCYQLLTDLANFIESATNGSIAYSSWRIQTTRALRHLLAYNQESPPMSPLGSHTSRRETVGGDLTRAQQVSSVVNATLGPLIDPEQRLSFENDLQGLVNEAISLWNIAEEDRLEFCFTLRLDKQHHAQWQTDEFNSTEADGKSVRGNQECALALFPRIIARRRGQTEPAMPGAFPGDVQEDRAEYLIHPGSGIPEQSPIIKEGKSECEERARRLEALDEKG